MVHAGTLMSKRNPSSRDCEKDRASGKPRSLPGVAREVQALLWTGTKTVFLMCLDVRPRWWHTKLASCLGHQNTFLWPLHCHSMLLSSLEMRFCCGRKGQGLIPKPFLGGFPLFVRSHTESTRHRGSLGGGRTSAGPTCSCLRGEGFSPHPTSLFRH